MTVKVWLPDLYTENHRRLEDKRLLARLLLDNGVEVVPDLDDGCRAILCGSVRSLTPKVDAAIRSSGLPLAHYVWDIYPFFVNGPDKAIWQRYIASLQMSQKIFVPSACTAVRVKEFTGRESTVVRCGVRPWSPPAGPAPPHLVGRVVDVMRHYEGEPNANAVSESCRDLGLPCLAAKTSLEWDDFRHAVSTARVLVSAYNEASTGGLTLVEGYWLGVPSLVSDSPFNGGGEYMGTKAKYFHWQDKDGLRQALLDIWNNPPRMPPAPERRQWVRDNLSEERFAANIAGHLLEIAK